MDFIALMLNGYVIQIGDPDDILDPAVFWATGDTVFAYAPELGRFEHPATLPEINTHINKMMGEGAKITIQTAAPDDIIKALFKKWSANREGATK